ncbi:hypothetical protein HID58_010491 [Brassica napus]|uniref:Uncharacterized protein n=1 Tax=Brassica napus TaxID=3708 RepID=A0ABQ8DVQ6_BRANA|nr:hypothetical protein HID58_010491 [Brassica napus]
MKGVGGPLLSIGDLLADLVEEPVVSAPPNPQNSSKLETDAISEPLDLTGLFQVIPLIGKCSCGRAVLTTMINLTECLLVLITHGPLLLWRWFYLPMGVSNVSYMLCTSLETVNKLVHATTTNARFLSEKVRELEKIVKQGDSAVAAARSVHATVNQKGLPS